jgi:hypothetical protein
VHVETDGRVQARQLLLGDPRLPQLGHAIVVRAPAAHCADVPGRRAQRDLEQRHIELRIVGEHTDRCPCIDRHLLQILVRPADHHLVGVGKALGRGEDPACVAHRHVISEELANPRDSRREVDGAEYQHPRRRREGLHEDGYLIHPALPVETVVPLTGAALRQHSPGIVIDRVVQSVRSE